MLVLGQTLTCHGGGLSMRRFSAFFVAQVSWILFFYKRVSTILFGLVNLALLLTISSKLKELCVIQVRAK